MKMNLRIKPRSLVAEQAVSNCDILTMLVTIGSRGVL